MTRGSALPKLYLLLAIVGLLVAAMESLRCVYIECESHFKDGVIAYRVNGQTQMGTKPAVTRSEARTHPCELTIFQLR